MKKKGKGRKKKTNRKRQIELCSIKSSANNEDEISRGLGESLLKKKKMIASRFSFSFSFFLSLFSPPVLPRYVSNPCLVFLQKVCSANAFQKPFFKAQWENIAIEV